MIELGPEPAACVELRARIRELRARWPEDARREWADAGHLPHEVFVDVGKAGCFRQRWSAGRTGGLRLATVLVEELSRVSGGLGLGISLHCELFCGLLVRLARTSAQVEVREAALDGIVVGCFASTEHTGGSSVASLGMTAVPEADGWRLRGRKCFVSNAGTADFVVALAKLHGAPDDPPIPFLVALDAPGVELVGFYRTTGVRSCDTAEIHFDTVVPAGGMLGSPKSAALHVQSVLLAERISASVQALTAGRVSLALAVAFARRRVTAGRRLMDHPVIRQRLAEVHARLRAAEALLASVLATAESGGDLAPAAAALKLVAARTGVEAADECMQVLGGRGYLDVYGVEEFWRDARLARIGGGTDEVMREIVAAGLDRPQAPFDDMVADLDGLAWYSTRGSG